MTFLIEFIIKQVMGTFCDSVFIILGMHLWNKIKYPFSFRKCLAVFLIFGSVGNLIGVEIGVVQGISKYIIHSNGVNPQKKNIK